MIGLIFTIIVLYSVWHIVKQCFCETEDIEE